MGCFPCAADRSAFAAISTAIALAGSSSLGCSSDECTGGCDPCIAERCAVQCVEGDDPDDEDVAYLFPCYLECSDGADCTTDCANAGPCSVYCTDSTCECAGDECVFECKASTCVSDGPSCGRMDCSEASSCDQRGESHCILVCVEASTCTAECGDQCQMTCRGGSTCDLACSGAADGAETACLLCCEEGATCDLQCPGGGGITCADGTLLCDGLCGSVLLPPCPEPLRAG